MDIDPIRNPELFTLESRASTVIGVAVFLMTGATSAVALRFYTRKVILNQLGVDDWLSLGALFFALATGISQCYLTTQGLGKHIGTLPQPDGFKNYMKTFYVVLVWYNIAIGLVKMTFLTQYYRVLATPKMRRICIIAMAIIGTWSLTQFLLTIFLCVPVAGFWDMSIRATCIPTLPEWYQNAAGNILTDIVIFCLPLPMLGRLNLPKTQKWILLGIFSLGFFTCTISIIRIKYLHLELDATWENVDSSLWSLCELCSGTTCSCLPCLRPLASRWLPVLSSKYGKGYKQQSDPHTHSGEGHVDLEFGHKRHVPHSSAESDSDMIFGLDDYRSNASSSGDDPGAFTGNAQMTLSILESTGQGDLKIPEPSRTTPRSGWVQPSMATRVERSRTPINTTDRYWSGTPIIRVKREISVHKSAP